MGFALLLDGSSASDGLLKISADSASSGLLAIPTCFLCDNTQFGNELDLTISDLNLCGSVNYNFNCGLPTQPFDASASLGDPNGTFRLVRNLIETSCYVNNTDVYMLESGDWLYRAECIEDVLGWSVTVAIKTNLCVMAYLRDPVLIDIPKVNGFTEVQCGNGNCEDTEAQCGFGGTALLEVVV